METINLHKPPKPCDYLDMIGGTSTSGWVITSVHSQFVESPGASGVGSPRSSGLVALQH
jgi:hypothetical protein